jgi:hypothetical protein
MCRWHSGEVSFVWASNKDDAVFKLDEQGNAETCPLIVVPDFMIHLTLQDDGELALSDDPFGEATEGCVSELAYPVLNELGDNASPEQLRQAVEKERTRLLPGPAPQPQSADGRSLKKYLDASTVVVERLQELVNGKSAGRVKPKGKRPKGPGRPH